MKQIQLVGPVDKRAVAYPLFKLCDTMGKTLVVTDDANFRRFSDDYTNDFTVGRSDFRIVNDVSQAILTDLGLKFNSYDFVLFITTNVLIENNDCLVYCHGNSQMICTEDVLDTIEEIPHSEVTISTQKSGKGDIFLSVDGRAFNYIWDCEENKMFVSCKNTELVKLCTHLFSETMGLQPDNMAQIMARNDYEGEGK